MNVLLKKRIIMYSLFLVLMLVISSFFIKEKAISVEVETKVETDINSLAISKDENGSIGFEENDFFKKYTINCTKDITDLEFNEEKDNLKIKLDKSQVLNINIKKGSKVNPSESNFNDDKNLYIINFKKLIMDENYVHVDFQNKKKILVFIKKKETPYKYKVVVDPGHGGVDAGAYVGKLLEKDLNLKIAKYMLDNLRYNGCNVVLTRDKDKELDKLVKTDLIKRSAIANDKKADLFVSIHINSNTVSVYNGVSTYYYDPSGFQKTERLKFAQTMQNEMLKSDDWKDMGEHRQELAVLKRSNMPSVLVECGFITNASDRDKLSKEATLVNFGLNISNGVLKYLAEGNISK
ncbi:MAG: N-acetylmuramoyl-L-alanine amidase [Clostridiaceae bacterium]|nr:N-acetylmuramoyl-L-alanine amidase [Clostridiaceae bacterium]